MREHYDRLLFDIRFGKKQYMLRNSLWLLLLMSVVTGQMQADWQSLYYRDHPLVGKIYSSADETWISQQQMDIELKKFQFILLGEIHTNLDHHIGQADIIHRWLTAEKETALVFEMLAYDNWNQSEPHKLRLSELLAQLEEVASKWDWQQYSPILQIQIDHQLQIVGANLSDDQRSEFSKGESCGITRQGSSLEFCELLDENQRDSIRQLIFDAHCTYLPVEHIDPLLNIQIAKDASFALTLSEIGATHKAVLIAGAVHVRKDIGVPVHLKRLGGESISIAFIDVAPEKLSPKDYFDQPNLDQQFDYIYFTPSERNQDPCVEFEEQLKKMEKH